MDVTAAGPVQESPTGLVIAFALDAENVNQVPLPLREVRYDVVLGEPGPGQQRWTFSGVRSPEATLRPGGTQQIVLPAAFELAAPGDRPTGEVPFQISATVYYITPGALADLLFDAGVRRPRTRFTDAGVVDLGLAARTAAPESDRPR